MSGEAETYSNPIEYCGEDATLFHRIYEHGGSRTWLEVGPAKRRVLLMDTFHTREFSTAMLENVEAWLEV